MTKWTKTTPYGDYNDPLDNHKFDGKHCMRFYDKDNKIVAFRTKRHEILHYCRVLKTHGKHVGSKPHRCLISAIKSAIIRVQACNEILKVLEEKAKNTDKVTNSENQ